MAFTYPFFELILSIIKIPNCVISLILAFKIKHLSSYVLNHLYYLAFLGWGVFIGLDAILFPIAALSTSAFSIANVMRDVCVVVIAMIPLSFIIASQVIVEGEEIAILTKQGKLLSMVLINFVLAIVMVLTDSIKVYDASMPAPWPSIDPATLPPVTDYAVNFDTESELSSLGSAMIIVFVAWYAYSVYLMFMVQRRQAGVRKRRARRVMLGVFMIPAGIVYFMILGYIPSAFSLDRLVLVMLGHAIWTLAPVLVYLGMRLQVLADDGAMVPAGKNADS